MKLYFRRLAIYYKNHIDTFALIFAVLAMITFTLAVYVYTPLNNKLIQTRWPWAQGVDDPDVPFTMIQFFAFLSSMLGVLCLINYRGAKGTKKLLFKIGFYVLSAIQLVNDLYYIFEIKRHLSGTIIYKGQPYTSFLYEYPADAGITFTLVHFILLAIAIVVLIFAPYIQKFTSKIQLKPISMQDKEVVTTNEVILEAEGEKNQYGYNLSDIDEDLIKKVLDK